MRTLTLFMLLTACEPAAAPTEGASGTANAAPVAPVEASAAAPETDVVVATWKGGELKLSEVNEAAQSQLTSMELEYLQNRYNTQRQARDSLVIEKLLELEVADRKLADVDALITIEVEQKITPATDAEVEQLYAVMQRQLRGATLDQVRDLVAGEVDNRKKQERFTVWVEELKAKYELSGSVPFPDLPRIDVSVDDDPQIGPDDALVTIVQFAEYQCGYCGKARESVDQVMDAYEGKVRMVYRDFPLGFHDRAIPAAVAANCAGEQGKYWEMHNMLMDDQRSLEDSTFERYAQKLQLDMNAFASCRSDPAQTAEVNADFEDGQKAGVTGTPAFFINGIMISGAQPFEQFKTIIDRELDPT